MALRVGHHRGGLAIGLAEEAVGGPGDEAVGFPAFLHEPEELPELLLGQGEVLADRGQCAALESEA